MKLVLAFLIIQKFGEVKVSVYLTGLGYEKFYGADARKRSSLKR